MDSLVQDLRFATRSLLRTPGLTFLAVLLLAIGIGSSTAIYSVVEGVVLRGLPFHEPDRLVTIYQTTAQRRGMRRGGTSADFAVAQIRANARSVEGVSEYMGVQPVMTGLGEPVRISAWLVKSDFFSLLGSRPLIGRAFLPEEDRPQGPRSVILSHTFWTRYFGRDPNVLGRALTLDGRPVEIVGVMPPGFDFPPQAAAWQSAGTRVPPKPIQYPQGGFRILARLKPDASIGQLQAELDSGYASLAGTVPIFKNWFANVMPLKDDLVGELRQPLFLILGAVALLLIVACANVASLLLARAVGRRRELATRLALGAGRVRIGRQLLTESLLLTTIGGASGVALAITGIPALLALAGNELPKGPAIAVNAQVLMVTSTVVLLIGVACGLVPAFQTGAYPTAMSFRDGSPATGSGRRRNRAMSTFVVLQIAVTMTLLTGAALLGASFVKVMNVRPGFEVTNVTVAQVRLPQQRYSNDAQRIQFIDRTVQQLQIVPGLQRGAISAGVPLSGSANGSIAVDGKEVPGAHVYFTMVTPEFFDVYRIPVIRGRPLMNLGVESPDSVIVSDELARIYFPGVDPIGHTVTFFDKYRGRVVGIAADMHQEGLHQPIAPHLYAPITTVPEDYLSVSVRTAAHDPEEISRALRKVIQTVDPILPVDKVTTVESLIRESTSRLRFYSTLLGLFAILSVVIAGGGIYAVAAYAASRRTAELAIRAAIGAGPSDLISLMLGDGTRLTAVGVILGIASALAATRLLASLLFATTPTDPTVFVATTLVLSVGALLAFYLPARRAARVDPAMVLRTE